MSIEIDQVLVSVIQRRLKSITEEMGLALLRTTRSPILNEARDFVTGLYDEAGDMLEQTEYIPVLAFALQPVCKEIAAFFGDDLHPGDVILHNDVFSGGNQNNDVAAFRPIFVDGELVAWAACKGHQADIGGAVAGGYNPDAREVWQEALRIPPLKVIERGRRREDVWRMVFANIRYPIVEQDIEAQIGGTAVGERGILELIGRYGLDVFRAHKEELFASTERMVAREIGAIPDGTYRGESTVFYDGVTDGTEMTIRLEVTVEGGGIAFDYSGSSPQTPGFVNAPYAATASATMLTFLMLIDPDIPHNAGLLRPIRIVNPEGSFLNAAFPAATTFGNSITGPTSDAIMRALATALPKTVTAGWNRFLGFAVSGDDPRTHRHFVDILFLALKGGSGATWEADGYDHIGLINCAGGILAQDYEMFEIQNPLLLERHEYLIDSAGPGRWRGGLGVETAMRIEGEDVTAVAFGDGIEERARAFGLFGGGAGSVNASAFRFPDGGEKIARSKEIVRGIPPGTVFRQRAGGGGGYGPPRERPAETGRRGSARRPDLAGSRAGGLPRRRGPRDPGNRPRGDRGVEKTMTYRPPIDDILFLLHEVIGADSILARPEFAHVDPESLEAAVRQAGRVASDIVAPVNAAADRIGATLENGVVRLPPGFVDAYEAFRDGGWPGLALPEEYGGQAMPEIAQAALSEMSNGASLAFSMLPVCGRAAARVLLAHAEADLQALWLPKLASGEWSGTIVMTEPHAGSDIGQARTKAVARADGSYALTGTKIFISFGDHDATPQNAHIVLARIEGAPPGVRGLSLFLVPRVTMEADGTLGPRNAIAASRIEEKMGIHGSPTCEMRLDGATGYLLGEPERGIQNMFTMINTMRLEVALEGVGIAGAALDKAARYASERVQGGSGGAATAIVEHADIRRTLLRMKALTGGARALCYETAALLDRGRKRRGRVPAADLQGGGERDRGRGGEPRDPGPRRPRLHIGAWRGTADARRAHHADLRGNQRDPGGRPAAPQDRPGRREDAGRAVRARGKRSGARRRQRDRRRGRGRARRMAPRLPGWRSGWRSMRTTVCRAPRPISAWPARC